MWLRWGKYVQKPELVFLVLASVFGILSAVIVPQLAVPDENMHFLRTYTIAAGHLAGDGDNKCVFPKDVYQRAANIYKGDYQAHYSQKISPENSESLWCGTASGYSPIVYIPQVVGLTLAKLVYPSTGAMILLGRLAAIAFYVGALYYLIKKVQIGKWVFVVIALFPATIHEAASLSADGVTNIAFFTFVAFLLNLTVQKTVLSRGQIVLMFFLAAALALTKLPHVLLLLLIPFMPTRLFNMRFSSTSPLLKAGLIKWYAFLGAGLFALLCALAWQHVYGQNLIAAYAGNPIPHHPWKFVPILFHTYVYMDPKTALFGFTGLGGFGDFILSSVVGGYASYRYWLPQILIFVGYALLLLALLKPNKDEDKLLDNSTGRLALGSMLALGMLIVAISYSLYVMWALPLLGPTAYYVAGVQGRYFVAAIALLIPVGVWLRRYVTVTVRSDVVFGSIVAIASGFLLLFYILQTIYAIHLGKFV
jgi:uncharacterized membrane protein